jgi:hypothetical protein
VSGPPPIPPQAAENAPAVVPSPPGDDFDRRDAISAWMVSFAVHAAVLFLMGVLTFGAQHVSVPLHLLAAAADAGPADGGAVDFGSSDAAPGRQGDSTEGASAGAAAADLRAELPAAAFDVSGPIATKITRPTVWDRAAETRPSAPPTGGSAKQRDGKQGTEAAELAGGGGLDGRGDRAGRAGRGGGTRASENAVERGLRWLAAHQREDGSWSFDLTKPPCNGMCRNSGTEASATAATGLALLPFLGAGYTHQTGEHREIVKRGLYFLNTRAALTPHGLDLRDGGTMYAQALATIAMCESYGMTHDTAWKEPARDALRLIVWAQDLTGGGWRYTPGTPGDVTVTGWQLMALKSGQLAKIEAPSPTINLVQKFLDGVQFDGGSRYYYMLSAPQRETQATTAVGLLLRMYTGWSATIRRCTGASLICTAGARRKTTCTTTTTPRRSCIIGKAPSGRRGTPKCATISSRRNPAPATRPAVGRSTSRTATPAAGSTTPRWPS